MQTPPVHFGQLKFIPVRGRRLKATIYITALCKVKIYPREGTETRIAAESAHNMRVEIYPREGTETIV